MTAIYPQYIGEYPIANLKLNFWNPNHMDEVKFKSLVKSIKERKFIVPIVANTEGLIVDGQHRYLASKECGLEKVPVVMVDMTEDEMKLSTLGLNGIKGENIPLKLAQLLQDLNQRHSLEEIAESIGFDAEALKDKLELLKIPDGLVEQLKEDARNQEQSLPVVLNFVLTKEQETMILETLEVCEGKSRGEKLMNLCTAYMKPKMETEAICQ
jgi:ParB/RepB/Spo0J family partition protein